MKFKKKSIYLMHWEQPVTAMAWYRRRRWNDAGLEEDEVQSVPQMDMSGCEGRPDGSPRLPTSSCVYINALSQKKRERCPVPSSTPHLHIYKNLVLID